MNLRDLQNKKLAMLGLGKENYALILYLKRHKTECQITICDARKNIIQAQNFAPLRKLKNTDWQLGKNFNKNLNRYDILFRSPGWPIDCPEIKKAVKAGAILSSPIKLFFGLCPTKNIIGVTGTKGKGTTASLIFEILKSAGKRVWLGGNIGIAPFNFIDKIKKNDWLVLELSSFQLEDMDKSPHIAVMTNFYPEHLAAADPNNPNYHKSLKAYWEAKMNIARWQKGVDHVILNSKFKIPACHSLALAGRQNSKLQVKSQKLFFSKSRLPSKLIGEHNKENIAAAVEVAKIIGIKTAMIKKAVAKFKGLEHRLEFVRLFKGVKYYDDSFATTPESTITALKSFNQPIILFLGGAEKNSDFKELSLWVKKKVKFIILLKGDASPRLKNELIKIGFKKDNIRDASSINEAVKVASQQAVKNDIVLLSTACASFGMFKNYKERGNLFKRAVKELK